MKIDGEQENLLSFWVKSCIASPDSRRTSTIAHDIMPSETHKRDGSEVPLPGATNTVDLAGDLAE